MTYRCASVESLTRIKGVTPEVARHIRKIWRAADHDQLEVRAGPELYQKFKDFYGRIWWTTTLRQRKRSLISQLIPDGSGEEYLGLHRVGGRHIYYVNRGDSYASTILFIGSSLYVGRWGDLVERNLVEADP